MKQELKPCYCGSNAKQTPYGVRCRSCGLSLESDLYSQDELIEKWNTRPDRSGESAEMIQGETLTTEIDWKHLELKIIERLVGGIDLSIPSNTCPSHYSPMIKTAIDIAEATIFQLKKTEE